MLPRKKGARKVFDDPDYRRLPTAMRFQVSKEEIAITANYSEDNRASLLVALIAGGNLELALK